MRTYLLLATTALLAACGGGGTNSTPPPPSAPGGGGSPAPTPAPTHSFAKPTETKTYIGVGGSQVYEYMTDTRICNNCGQQAQLYAGNTTTIRNSGIALTYDPSGAVFTLKVTDPASGADIKTTFQDPANRTDFGGTVEPQWGTPRLTNPNIGILQAGDGTPRAPYDASGSGFIYYGTPEIPPDGDPGSTYQSTSMFYLKPGTETKYVSLAGFTRNALIFGQVETPNDDGTTTKFKTTEWSLTRGAFAYGEVTATNAVPKIGTGAYKGSMMATMVFNPTLDDTPKGPNVNLGTYFQWIEGTAALDVNFASNTFDFLVNGSVLAPQFDRNSTPSTVEMRSVIPAGATFTAKGLGTINLVNFGGFKGNFNTATVGGLNVNIAGSAIDGTFYGPTAEEAGGSFRIVGGTPDERIDILGAFVGTK